MLCRVCADECDEYKLLHVEGLLMGKVTTLAALLHFCTGLDFMEQDNMLPEQMCVSCMRKLAKACTFKQMVIEVDEYLRDEANKVLIEACDNDGDGNSRWNQQDDIIEQMENVDEISTLEYYEEEIGSANDGEPPMEANPQAAETMVYNVAENVEIGSDDVFVQQKQDVIGIVLDGVVEIIEYDQDIEYKTDNGGCSNEEVEVEELDIEYNDGDEIEHITVERHSTELEGVKDEDMSGSIYNVEQNDNSAEEFCETQNELNSISPSNVIHATQLDVGTIECTEKAVEDDDTDEQSGDDDENSEKKLMKDPNLRCDICGKYFKNLKTYKGHMKRHDPFNPKSCEFCGKTYRELKTLKKHLLSHTGEKPLACNICGRHYRFRSNLVAHMRQHTGEKPFKCTECSRGFGTKRHLARHASVHSRDRPYICDLCGKTFAQQRYLDMHKFRHTGIKPCQCHICGKSLSRNSELKKHFLTHTGEKPFKCDICSQQFRDQANLRVHKRQHTGDRPYACTYCDKKYPTSTQLKAHTMLHTGERPHTCSICGKGYRVLRSLQRHTLTHTGEKQFKCDMCSFEFRYESNLISHRRLHQREVSKCPNCDKSFRTAKLLNRHIQMRHMQNEKPASTRSKLKRNAEAIKSTTEKPKRPQMPDVADQKVCKSNIVELY